ncbi:MAG: hypothetical protein M1827_002410 [Pycnora praestabilis]|nr:MAG: hypothetical protein M1827_002410 [Pycnora praestabilis]
MSFLRNPAMRSAIRPAFTPSIARSQPSFFHSSTIRAALSESDHDLPDRKEKIEHHKNDQLDKQKEGKGHWKGELASNSEGAIAADRGTHDHSEKGIKEMQDATAQHAEETHEESKKN